MTRQKIKQRQPSIPPIEYETVLDAIRGAAEKYGDGGYRELSLVIPKDEWPKVRAYLRKHGRKELERAVLCLCAEAR